MSGIDQEEPRIETARAARRRERTEHELQRLGRGQVAGCGKGFPVGRRGHWPVAGRAEHQSGFLPQFADRPGGQRMLEPRFGVFGQAFTTERRQRAGQRDLCIARVDGTAGKDELVGHKRGLGAALSHQDGRFMMTVAQHDHRGRVPDCRFVYAHSPPVRGASLSRFSRSHRVAAPIDSRQSPLSVWAEGRGINQRSQPQKW